MKAMAWAQVPAVERQVQSSEPGAKALHVGMEYGHEPQQAGFMDERSNQRSFG